MQTELQYISANGLRFAYFEQGSGPLVLLLHGFPDAPHTWAELQPQIASAGYRVVAPFMRGYPPSEVPSDADYSALKLGGDVLDLIGTLGEQRAIVIGHDWGAFAGYAAAAIDPPRITKLVPIAIPHPAAIGARSLIKGRHFITFQFRSRAVASLRRDNFAQVEKIYRRWSPNWNVTEDDLAPVKASLAAPGGVEGALGYYWSFRRNAIGKAGAASRALLRAPTTVPTLAFFGEADGALDLSSVDRTRKWFTGQYEIVRVPGAGHFLHHEAPAVFLEHTLPFIAS